MKKALIYWFTFLLILLAFSCKTPQVLHDKTASLTEVIKTKDSTTIVDRSGEINDSLSIVIGYWKTEKKECDSTCTVALNNMLAQLNYYKKSGNNTFQMHYNPATKTIDVKTKIGETKNETVQTNLTTATATQTATVREIAVEKPFSREQLFNLWTGRLFWISLICFTAIKIYQKLKNPLT